VADGAGGAVIAAPARALPDAGTAAVVDAVMHAARARTPLRIVGAGSWLDAGRPVLARQRLELGPLVGITEYTPGDLTLTARAGTPLSAIEAATGAERQWLPFDPFGAPGGTLGATVATASAGPLAHAFGLPRDNVLGLEFVTGAGNVVRGGGRVVKNVAGFDLTRLLVGSWGTLGAITEVTVRLRARPEADVTLALRGPALAAPGPLLDALRTLGTTAVAPLALELLAAPLAAQIGLGAGPALLARLGGNEPFVRGQRSALAQTGDWAEAPADVWERLRGCEPPAAGVVRFSAPPSQMAATWAHALAVCAAVPGAFAHASVGRGVARCVVPTGTNAERAALAPALAAPFAGTRVVERLPAELWPAPEPSRVRDRLERGVRRTFDQQGILNPGILGA
jgi:glycolate oxidase FAD binding subunit